MKPLTLPLVTTSLLIAAAPADDIDLLTGDGVSLGEVLYPHLHVASALAGTTADSVSDLSVGHHDPQRDFSFQTIEPGVSLRFGMLEGFATYAITSDPDGDLSGEWEEAFLKLKDIPGGFEIRGGRYFNRFGFQNATHSHAWEQVNNTLLNGILLQEGELITDGAEITWNAPTPFKSAFSFSYGKAPAHSEGDHNHGHGHDDEDEHHEDEHEDEHHDEHEEEGHHDDHHDEHEDEHGEEEHHDEDEHGFEAEGARFVDTFFSAQYLAEIDYNDFHRHRFNVSFATGENEFGGNTRLYGAGYEYSYRENGFEPGGRSLTWRNEVAYRRFEATSEEDERSATLDDLGVYSMLTYGFNDHVSAGVRVGYATGIEDTEAGERFRVSPTLTLSSNAQRTLFTRLQYDYDQFEDGDEHSVFLQVGFNWGGPEVR